MCGYLCVRHANCGHDTSRLETPCLIEESLPGQDLCRQHRHDMGMKQENTLCSGCQRHSSQMYRHGFPSDPLATLSAEIKARLGRNSRTSSIVSTSSQELSSSS